MPCELCGREVKGCKLAIIDGAKIRVCPECTKYAEGIPEEAQRPPAPVERFIARRSRPPKDIYKEISKELVPNWNHLIEDARKAKGLTRQDLGFKVGERTVTIAKIENGDLRPSDQLIGKLEKELSIKLLEEISAEQAAKQPSAPGAAGFTLGDFIKSK